MRAKSVNIKGINRQVGSPDNDDGYCSELVNMKVQNGLKITGNKVVKSANIPYNRISIHKIGKIQNYIGVRTDADGIYIDHFNPDSGALVQNIATFKANSEIYYVLLNNQVVISDKTAIKEYVYQFSDSYKLHYSGIDLDFDITFSNAGGSGANPSTIELKADTKDQYLAGIQSQINKFEVENPKVAEGYVLCALTLTFNDGTEDRMFGLQYIEPYHNSSYNFIMAMSKTSDSIKTRFDWSGYYSERSITVRENKDLYERYKGIIKNVNLYVSKPITRFPISIGKVTVSGMGWEYGDIGVTDVGISIPQERPKDAGLDKTLLYKQKSWTLEEFCATETHYNFEFGGDKQVTGATMEVYGSDIERAGKMFAYNNRVHFYNTNARLKMKLGDMQYYSSDPDLSNFTFIYAYATILVKVKASIEDLVFRFDDCRVVLGQIGGTEYKLVMPNMAIFPDSRSYQADVIITSIRLNSNLYSSAVGKKYVLSLSASPAYNYSYFYGGPDNAVTPEGIFDGAYPELVDVYKETNAINVSSSGTPFVFPVANSYKFDGNITTLAVAMQQISDAQVGQYPLNVFTDNGIFALEQGGGTVLYSNIVPLTADTCLNGSVHYTFQGIAYISNGAVYVLNGRTPTKMTAFLEGQPDVNIQNNESFLKCCGGELYDISDSLSQVDFKEYVNDAKLSWCANTNELIVSNSAYSYSYVYDFYFNAWYKVTGVYEAIEDNLILRPISLNTGSVLPATGKVTLSAIHTENAKTISSVCQASFPTNLACGAGHTVALLIDNIQVASAVFQQVTYTNMMVSVLCDTIGYLEDYKGVIYSMTDLSTKSLRLFNVTTGADIFSNTFVATSHLADLPAKAIGATVTVTVQGKQYSQALSPSSSVITVLNSIAENINDNDNNVVAVVRGNVIHLTAKTSGTAGNNIQVSASSTDPDYIYINTTAMTGGEDISLKPSSYKEIVDWSMEKPSAQQTIHLHTRPMSFGNVYGYKTIRRTVMSLMASLKGQENLSMYIFASDNLIDWKCVCAAQRKDCNISQITCDRSAKAHKYFILMIGGLVENNTQISTITMAIEDVVNKKLR